MEIIDKFSRTLGLVDKEEKESEAPEELPKEQPQQNETPIQPPPETMTGHNVVDFNSARAARDNLMTTTNNIPTKPMVKTKITTIRPKSFDEDARIIADCLRENIPVIINLEETNPGHAQRIIDFIGGACDALDGSIQGISNNIFIAAPSNVAVTGDLRDEILNESSLSRDLNRPY